MTATAPNRICSVRPLSNVAADDPTAAIPSAANTAGETASQTGATIPGPRAATCGSSAATKNVVVNPIRNARRAGSKAQASPATVVIATATGSPSSAIVTGIASTSPASARCHHRQHDLPTVMTDPQRWHLVDDWDRQGSKKHGGSCAFDIAYASRQFGRQCHRRE